MTNSEIHAVMTGGFATIAGAALAGYIRYFARMNTCNTVDIEKKNALLYSFGVSASHLLSASVMSAPAALAMAKLMFPGE